MSVRDDWEANRGPVRRWKGKPRPKPGRITKLLKVQQQLFGPAPTSTPTPAPGRPFNDDIPF